MATTVPPTELWVLLKSNDSAVVNQAVLVSTQDCRFVTHIIEAIKKLSPKLDQVPVDNITLHLTEDGPALEPYLALSDLAAQPGYTQNTGKSPLLVVVPPAAPKESSSKKQLKYKAKAAPSTGRDATEALAAWFFERYEFPLKFKEQPGFGDVLVVRKLKEGKELRFRDGRTVYWRHRKQDPDEECEGNPDANGLRNVADKDLCDVFTDEKWNRLAIFQKNINQELHAAKLSQTSSGQPFVVLSDINQEYADDLMDAWITAFPGKGLVVKKDSDLSGSSGAEGGSPVKGTTSD